MKATPVFPKWFFHEESAFTQEELSWFEDFSVGNESKKQRKVSLQNGQQKTISTPDTWPTGIQKKLYAYIDKVCEFYTPEKPAYRIDAMWFNVMDEGAYNVPHNHQGSWISGIIYVRNCKDINTVFLTERNLVTPNKAFQHNVFSPAVKDGDLVMFESDLWHWVPPVPNNKDRLTFAFNVQLNKYRQEQTILVPEIKFDI